jgi:two-component system nitrogen regulation sensor histidine kinase GlnL
MDGVVVVDEWGIVRQLNDASCRILETSSEALVGRPVEDVHGADHAIARLARAAIETARGAVESDQRVERKVEGNIVVDVSASPIFDDLGNVDGALVVLGDRTLRRVIEADAAERERLDWSARIALGIAHEVKNPLGGIRGAGELLVQRADDPKTRETAQLIVREVDRIANLVDDFMVLARDEEIRVADVNLHQVLDGVLDLVGHDAVAAGCQVVRHYDPSIPELPGDAERLAQVFHNLARNAFEAMEPDGGTLTVSTRMALAHRLTRDDGSPVPTVAIGFRDTGPGIPGESMDKVWTPFFTTRKKGTGLGVPLADHWVTRHGGRLRVESPPDEGACVTVYLPLRRLA